jgi:hypothetical protein
MGNSGNAIGSSRNSRGNVRADRSARLRGKTANRLEVATSSGTARKLGTVHARFRVCPVGSSALSIRPGASYSEKTATCLALANLSMVKRP